LDVRGKDMGREGRGSRIGKMGVWKQEDGIEEMDVKTEFDGREERIGQKERGGFLFQNEQVKTPVRSVVAAAARASVTRRVTSPSEII